MELAEGVGEKRWAKKLPDICLSWAHRLAAEHPLPTFTQEMRTNCTHVQTCQAQSLGLCVDTGVH